MMKDSKNKLYRKGSLEMNITTYEIMFKIDIFVICF